MADPALVLLCLPVEAVGPDGRELVVGGWEEREAEGEERVENAQVEVVPRVGPDEHEGREVRARDRVGDVVEAFACLAQKTKIVSFELDWITRGSKMELLTARKKSLISCVTYTAIPMYAK